VAESSQRVGEGGSGKKHGAQDPRRGSGGYRHSSDFRLPAR
jgi:hypothetical protein